MLFLNAYQYINTKLYADAVSSDLLQVLKPSCCSEMRRSTVTAAEAKKALELRKAEDGMRREVESKRRETELQEQLRREEERRRKHVIAPDGESGQDHAKI